MAIDVWIDTDPAIGVPGADVDDGLALIQAFHSPELRLRGVSAVFGNAPLAQSYPLACEVVERFGPDGLAVASGAAAAEDLGRENDAVRAMARALEAAPLTLLAIGPLTNVGSLLLLHPELAERLRSVVMVAARRPGQRFVSVESQPTPFPDFNFECDPAALRVVLESDVGLVFAPWEVSSHVWITGEDLDRLATASESGAYIAEQSRGWLELWTDEMGATGFNPFDSLAVAWLTHPALIEHFEAPVWIAEGPSEDDSGKKPHLLVDPAGPLDATSRGRTAVYCHRPASELKPLLLERLARRP